MMITIDKVLSIVTPPKGLHAAFASPVKDSASPYDLVPVSSLMICDGSAGNSPFRSKVLGVILPTDIRPDFTPVPQPFQSPIENRVDFRGYCVVP